MTLTGFLRMSFPSVALVAMVLMACTSVATGFSFAPVLSSLCAPGGALRSDFSTCLATTSHALRGPSPGGLSTLSMKAVVAKGKAIAGVQKASSALQSKNDKHRQGLAKVRTKSLSLK